MMDTFSNWEFHIKVGVQPLHIIETMISEEEAEHRRGMIEKKLSLLFPYDHIEVTCNPVPKL